MKNSTKILAIMTLFISTMLVLSSENWFSMWMGLEINMMSFIPLLKENNNKSSSEAMMMYFLIQSLSSMIFMFSIMMNPIMLINDMYMINIMTVILTSSMLMKLGTAPMHMWFINIMNKMSWNNCLIIMTWQKLAPMFILSQMNYNNLMMNICIMLTALTGAIGGINQTSLKKIMAFSSVNHLSWMMLCMKNNSETWIKYLIMYSIMMMIITKIFNMNSMNHINQMNIVMKSYTEKINMTIMFMSIGGLPPFIGFLPKWMAIQSSMYNESMFIILMLIMSSMITLFYYMRIISPILMYNSSMNKWNFLKNKKENLNKNMMILNLILPMLIMMMNLN